MVRDGLYLGFHHIGNLGWLHANLRIDALCFAQKWLLTKQ